MILQLAHTNCPAGLPDCRHEIQGRLPLGWGAWNLFWVVLPASPRTLPGQPGQELNPGAPTFTSARLDFIPRRWSTVHRSHPGWYLVDCPKPSVLVYVFSLEIPRKGSGECVGNEIQGYRPVGRCAWILFRTAALSLARLPGLTP